MIPFQQQSLSQRLHIDVPLCFGLVTLCSLGLIVLYSAGGEDMSLILRQIVRLSIAFVLMFLVAQLPPAVIERWSLWLFIVGIAMLIGAVVVFSG